METCLGRERAGECQYRLWGVSTAPLLVGIAASCTWWVGEGGSFLPDANQERGHVNFFNKGQELELSRQSDTVLSTGGVTQILRESHFTFSP